MTTNENSMMFQIDQCNVIFTVSFDKCILKLIPILSRTILFITKYTVKSNTKKYGRFYIRKNRLSKL